MKWIKTRQQKPPFVETYKGCHGSTIQASDWVLANLDGLPVVGKFETISWPSGESQNRFNTHDGCQFETVSHWSPSQCQKTKEKR